MSSFLRNVSTLQWIDLSGAPLLVLPKQLENEWLGFYAEAPTDFQDEPDLWLGEVPYIIDDTFDFKRPRTDYDCICAESAEVFPYTLETGPALVLQSFYDAWAWLPDHQLLINGRLEQLNEHLLETLAWEELATWPLSDPTVFLMHSCCCTLAPDFEQDEFQLIQLPVGTYHIQKAAYADPHSANLFQFVLAP